jgi:hypothetical protein
MASPLIAARVSPETLRRLDAEVKRRGTSRAEVVRSLVTSTLADAEPEEDASQ